MEKMQNAAVIGHPIGHTMSPFLQERLFALQGLPLCYQVLDIPELSEQMETLRSLDCFNVTIPHKSNIIPFLADLTEKARLCGSVNTVRVENGKLYGTTTDGIGCRKALERHGLELSGNILLLGNGGAAKALAFETADRPGFHLTIACRKESFEKAKVLADSLADTARKNGKRGFRIVLETYEELEADKTAVFDLLLNATSVGMTPHAGVSPVSEQVISRCAAVFDAVYNPEETELLRLAKKLGKETVGGMEMLVYQAAESHEFWYGSRFREEDLDKLCRDAAEELQRRTEGQG
ncbi:MAG: shikimate dehydrogenase [Acutalibacter sp.]|nr:shikimate dehydrogenase [Acutalibacter sp.]